MALALVGSKTFGHNATSAQSCSLTDLTGGLASQPAENDVVIVAYTHANVTTAARTLAQCTPSGYTNLHPSVLLQNDSNAISFAVSAKKMTASPDTTVSIPAASATTSNVHCTIEVWRDVDFANITTTAATTANAGNTGLPNPPSISTPSAPPNCVVLGCFGAAVANATATAIANAGATPYNSAFLTGSYNTGTGSRAHSGMGARTGLAVSTAFDAVLSGGATANTGSWAAVSVMLRPNVSPITASASPSLSEFTTSSAAKGVAEGIGSGTLNAFTSSATATVSEPSIHASASFQLSTFLSASAAKAVAEGIGSGTLNPFVTTSAAVTRIKATGSPSPNAFTVASGARVRALASASPVLSPFVTTSALRGVAEGIGSGVLNAFGVTSEIEMIVRASASIQLGNFTSAGDIVTVSEPSTLTGDIVLDPFLSDAAARAIVEGVGSGLLNAFTVEGQAAMRIGAAAAPEMWPFVCEASASTDQIAQLQGTAVLGNFLGAGEIAMRIGAGAVIMLNPFTVAARVGEEAEPPDGQVVGTLPEREAFGVLCSRDVAGSVPSRWPYRGPNLPSRGSEG